jgi:hypothetical protein
MIATTCPSLNCISMGSDSSGSGWSHSILAHRPENAVFSQNAPHAALSEKDRKFTLALTAKKPLVHRYIKRGIRCTPQPKKTITHCYFLITADASYFPPFTACKIFTECATGRVFIGRITDSRLIWRLKSMHAFPLKRHICTCAFICWEGFKMDDRLLMPPFKPALFIDEKVS